MYLMVEKQDANCCIPWMHVQIKRASKSFQTCEIAFFQIFVNNDATVKTVSVVDFRLNSYNLLGYTHG